jgi:hypothetical protein
MGYLLLSTLPRLLSCKGPAIAEDCTLHEKYYKFKLQANFMRISPAFLTTRPQNIGASQGAFMGKQRAEDDTDPGCSREQDWLLRCKVRAASPPCLV